MTTAEQADQNDFYEVYLADKRAEVAQQILVGWCANPAVYAPNSRCGWELVNCTREELAAAAFSLADVFMAERAKRTIA